MPPLDYGVDYDNVAKILGCTNSKVISPPLYTPIHQTCQSVPHLADFNSIIRIMSRIYNPPSLKTNLTETRVTFWERFVSKL